MGKHFEKPIKNENTLLNIIICNFNEEIQSMKFLDNSSILWMDIL